MSLDSSLVIAARLVVGAVLLLAGVAKGLRLQGFSKIVGAFDVVSKRHVRLVSLSIVLAECVVGVGLLTGVALRLWALIAAVLFVLFATAIAYNLLRGRPHIPCGCFGTQGLPINWAMVLRNLALVALSAAASGEVALAVPATAAAAALLIAAILHRLAAVEQPTAFVSES